MAELFILYYYIEHIYVVRLFTYINHLNWLMLRELHFVVKESSALMPLQFVTGIETI